MEPFTALVLIGLMALGASVTAFFVATALYIIGAVLLWATAVIMVLCGIIGDYRYDRRVAEGLAEFRLPFYYRWKGWIISDLSRDMVGFGYKSGGYYDQQRNRIIPMVRVVEDHQRFAR